MSDQATKTDLQNLEKRMEKRFDDLTALMSNFANDVSTQFSEVNRRLDEHDEEFRKLNKKYDHLIDTIDGFIARIDTYETELAARDHKIDRLERYIQVIAQKTGVDLDSIKI